MKRAIPILPRQRRGSGARQGEPEKAPRYKRARASRPKVKTGCITCKVRRVKCDETKPQCTRCLKFGRPCDGYEDASGNNSSGALVSQSTPSGSPQSYAPTLEVNQSEDENRYFQLFRTESAPQISGYFVSDFWTRIVLQESHTITPVRHAVIAIGALYKSLEETPISDLKVNVIQELNKRHLEAAVINYCKAIQTLQQYISQTEAPQLRVALICCLLFVCFETFMGSYAHSVQQTYGGLKILRSYYMGKAGSKPWIPRKPVPEKRRRKTREILHSIEEKPGYDHITKDTTLLSHLEEYLNTESSLEQHYSQQYSPAPQDQVREELYSTPPLSEVPSKREPQMPPLSISIPSGTRIRDSQPSTSKIDSGISMIGAQSENLSQVKDLPKGTASTSNDSIECPYFATFARSTPSSAAITQTIPERNNTPAQDPVLGNDTHLELSLIQTFVRTDGQGMFFGMVPAIPPLTWDIRKAHWFPIPAIFTDFPSAHVSWDFLMDRALQFFRGTMFNRHYAPSKSLPDAEIAVIYASTLEQLSRFERAFEPFLQANLEPGVALNPAALIVSLHLAATRIILSVIPTGEEDCYNAHMADFIHIIQLVSILQDYPFPRLAFQAGIIPPLHLVATKCRQGALRREAIQLLRNRPRQEGMWDGILTARIGEWVMGLEEEGLGIVDLIPKERMVRLKVVDFHMEDSFVIIKGERAVLDEFGARQRVETVLSW